MQKKMSSSLLLIQFCNSSDFMGIIEPALMEPYQTGIFNLGFKNYTLMGSRPIDYDYNYMDGSPVVGLHPILSNIFMAAGFNGRGAMYAPAVGRAIMELLLGKSFGILVLFVDISIKAKCNFSVFSYKSFCLK